MIEVFFIFFKDSAFIISFVSGVKGQFKLIISEEEKSSSKETCFASSKPLIFFLERLKYTTFIFMASAIFATAWPMFPKPTIPIVLSESSLISKL